MNHDVYKSIAEDYRECMPDYLSSSNGDCLYTKANEIQIYVNSDSSYFSLEVGGKKFVVHVRPDKERKDIYLVEVNSEEFYDEKIELLIVDALESALQFMQVHINKERIGYQKIIDKLFSNMIIRREKAEKTKEESTKYKIVQKEITKIYI